MRDFQDIDITWPLVKDPEKTFLSKLVKNLNPTHESLWPQRLRPKAVIGFEHREPFLRSYGINAATSLPNQPKT